LIAFPSEKFPAELEQNLSAALALAQTKTHASALTAAVFIPGRGFWTATRTLDPHAVPPRLFYWGSAGKAFTAVLILQLVEEGKLTLCTPIARWFPDYPNAHFITIDHLLTHTSGIFSFNQDLQHRRQPGYKSPATLIATARKHGNGFCPGEAWDYSNTGYVMLGLIIEKLDGRSYAESVDARIIRRLGLNQTRVLTSTSTFDDIAPAHPGTPSETEVGFSFATPFGAGCIAATAEDMVRFWHGLLSDQLLTGATVEQMFNALYPMFGQRVSFYGRGVMVTDLPDQPADIWLGHSGGTPGIKAEVIYSVATRTFVAVALNNDGSAQATVNLLLKTLRAEPLLPPESVKTGR
jgi:D-alanyl-D-alanine carboxypeptidase